MFKQTDGGSGFGGRESEGPEVSLLLLSFDRFYFLLIQIPQDIFCLALEGSGILAKQLWEAQER